REIFQDQNRAVGAGVALHAYGTDGQNPAFGGLFRLGCGGGTEATNSEAGAGEGMTVEQFGCYAEFAADGADFILIKAGQRLDDAAGIDQRLDSGYPVVMR